MRQEDCFMFFKIHDFRDGHTKNHLEGISKFQYYKIVKICILYGDYFIQKNDPLKTRVYFLKVKKDKKFRYFTVFVNDKRPTGYFCNKFLH